MKNKYKAKFIRKVTTVTSPRNMMNKYHFNKAENGKYYQAGYQIKWFTSNLKIGERVYIAKLRNTYRSTDYTWYVYEIELPTYKCYFSKEDSGLPQTYFGNNTIIIAPKQNRLNKKNS